MLSKDTTTHYRHRGLAREGPSGAGTPSVPGTASERHGADAPAGRLAPDARAAGWVAVTDSCELD